MTSIARVVAIFLILLASAAVAAEPHRMVLREQGQDGVHTYRIPGLATTTKGTLIAVFDVRHKSAADLPGDIDVGLMRSTDDGRTWSKLQTIIDFDAKEPKSRGNGVGDPAVLVDAKTGTIWVAALWSHGDRAWNGSRAGTSPDETGQLVLVRSDDDGATWSQPINITSKIEGRDPKWRLCFQGPGRGICLKDGSLVFAAQIRDADGTPYSCLLRSIDHGKTWKISRSPTPKTSEAQVAEFADGWLLASMRDESRSGERVWAYAQVDDKGVAWSKPTFDVPDPTCMASLIQAKPGVLLFSNPNSARQRVDLTVRKSNDDRNTWSEGSLLEKGPCAYSCMTVLRDGSIGILYEAGPKTGIEKLIFARFDLDWVK
jgi:sialidase-1